MRDFTNERITLEHGNTSNSAYFTFEDGTEPLRRGALADRDEFMAELATRWNEHAELLALVRQLAVTEVNTMSLDCAPTAARALLARLGRTA